LYEGNYEMNVDRSSWPILVRIGLWGLPNPVSAWACFWLSILLALASVAYGFVDPRFFLGGIMVIAALWYYLSIRWVNRHGAWS
jgi:hypothetical protein